MNLKVFSFFGILAPLFYIIPTIVGVSLRPGYNHIAISKKIMVMVPVKLPIVSAIQRSKILLEYI